MGVDVPFFDAAEGEVLAVGLQKAQRVLVDDARGGHDLQIAHALLGYACLTLHLNVEFALNIAAQRLNYAAPPGPARKHVLLLDLKLLFMRVAALQRHRHVAPVSQLRERDWSKRTRELHIIVVLQTVHDQLEYNVKLRVLLLILFPHLHINAVFSVPVKPLEVPAVLVLRLPGGLNHAGVSQEPVAGSVPKAGLNLPLHQLLPAHIFLAWKGHAGRHIQKNLDHEVGLGLATVERGLIAVGIEHLVLGYVRLVQPRIVELGLERGGGQVEHLFELGAYEGELEVLGQTRKQIGHVLHGQLAGLADVQDGLEGGGAQALAVAGDELYELVDVDHVVAVCVDLAEELV